MGRELERLFERYRRRGDLKALTRVFDRTARDLLGLAQHLVHDPHDAEDLVQTTFVTAIDRAESWDGRRDLRPWLTGILAHQASNLVRTQSRRQGEELGAVEAGEAGPQQAARSAELQEALTGALARVGDRYREVLEPYLRDGERPEAIARSLGRAPGTVRTQIHRGLSRLRRHLPAGVGAGLLFGSVRGLPSVRAAVLRHAAVHTGAAASATSITSALFLGGLVVSKKLLMLGAGALAGSIGLWIGVDHAPRLLAPAPATNPLQANDRPPVSLISPTEHAQESSDPVSSLESDRAPTRSTLDRGQAWIRGRIHGVSPEQLEEVQITVRRVFDGSPVNLDGQIADSMASLLVDLSRASADAGQVAVQGAWLDIQNQGRLLPSTGISFDRLQVIDPDSFLVLDPGQYKVRVGPQGQFEIELTRAILEGEGNDARTYAVEATHEVYFPDTGRATFAANARSLIQAGQEVVAPVDLELRPAAVLTGKVRRDAKPLEFITLESALTEIQWPGAMAPGERQAAALISAFPVPVTFDLGTVSPTREPVTFRIVVGPAPGGLALEASRVGMAGDVGIEWPGQQIAWSHGEVVRRGAQPLTEEGGVFTIHGLSPGLHERRLARTGAATVFSPEELQGTAIEVRIPATDVQFVLPIAVLDVQVQPLPLDESNVRLIVEDPVTGTVITKAQLDGDGRGLVVARPDRTLRLRPEAQALEFTSMEVVAPDAGARLKVLLQGRPVIDGRDH